MIERQKSCKGKMTLLICMMAVQLFKFVKNGFLYSLAFRFVIYLSPVFPMSYFRRECFYDF